MDSRSTDSLVAIPLDVQPSKHQQTNKSPPNGTSANMTDAQLPDCHNYPPIGTKFMTMEQFGQFRKFFCHMRNANFQTYNNNTSALYLCPNYKKCHGVLHGCRYKEPVLDKDGNFQYDKNGYLRYKTLPHLIIGPLTSPCDCIPDRYTSIEDSSKLFDSILHMTNIARTEFTHIANSYFAITGKDNYRFKSTGYNLLWSCLQCKTGCLQLTMNRNAKTIPSKYQSYGTITKASPCSRDCLLRTYAFAKKTIWLPESHKENEMALTSEQIEQKKQQHEIWVKEAHTIAKDLLTNHQIQKKPWKFDYMTEKEIRQRIEIRNTRISESKKKQDVSNKPTSSDRRDRVNKRKRKPFQTKRQRRSSKIQ